MARAQKPAPGQPDGGAGQKNNFSGSAADREQGKSMKYTFDVLEQISDTHNEFSQVEEKVAAYVLANPREVVNQSITHSDREGNLASFPKPAVSVDCDIVVHPEPCPEPVELTADGCQDSVRVDLSVSGGIMSSLRK